jgi:hypothetical protein
MDLTEWKGENPKLRARIEEFIVEMRTKNIITRGSVDECYLRR